MIGHLMPARRSSSSARAPGRRSGRCSGRSWPWILLALAWVGAIFWASSQPSPVLSSSEPVDILAKKGGHVGAYGVLAVLVWLGVRGRLAPRSAIVVAFAVAVGYGAFDELHQAFTPTRHPSPLDVGIDALGAAAGLWVASRLASGLAGRRVRSRGRRPPAAQ